MIKLKTRNEFALIPTKLTNKQWIWLKWFKRTYTITEHEGFENGRYEECPLYIHDRLNESLLMGNSFGYLQNFK